VQSLVCQRILFFLLISIWQREGEVAEEEEQAIESLASEIELREIGTLRARRENAGVMREADFGLWLSLVERLPRVQEVQGSNPCSPTFFIQSQRGKRKGHRLTRMTTVRKTAFVYPSKSVFICGSHR
jgi:hypothetical protein